MSGSTMRFIDALENAFVRTNETTPSVFSFTTSTHEVQQGCYEEAPPTYCANQLLAAWCRKA